MPIAAPRPCRCGTPLELSPTLRTNVANTVPVVIGLCPKCDQLRCPACDKPNGRYFTRARDKCSHCSASLGNFVLNP